MTQTAMQRQQPRNEVAVLGDNSIAKLNMRELKELADVFVASGAFADVKAAAQAMVKILAGQELGFSPIVSMTGVHFFNGKVQVGANLQASLIKSSGRYDYRITEHTEEACAIEFFRRSDAGWQSMGVPVRYTMADARTAQLAGKDNWKKYPKDMLFAACLRQGTRRYCADVLRGITAETDDDANDVNVTPPAEQIEAAEADHITVDGEIVDTATGEVIEDSDQQSADSTQEQNQAPTAPPPSTAVAETPGLTAPGGSVKTAVDLAYKLEKEFDVDAESLAIQFLPEGVALFSQLSEEQAAEAVPGLSEILNKKIAERKGGGSQQSAVSSQ